MAALGVEFKPRYAAMADAAAAAELRRRLGAQTEVLDGAAAPSELAAHPDADQVMSAIVGAVGLLPTLSAVRAGKSSEERRLGQEGVSTCRTRWTADLSKKKKSTK